MYLLEVAQFDLASSSVVPSSNSPFIFDSTDLAHPPCHLLRVLLAVRCERLVIVAVVRWAVAAAAVVVLVVVVRGGKRWSHRWYVVVVVRAHRVG